jgi:hypothetical protein
MKKKTKFIFSFFTIVFAVMALMSGCDMTMLEKPFTPEPVEEPITPPPPPVEEPVEEPEEPEEPIDPGYDTSVPYLTVVNLPANAQKSHFSNVFVYDGLGTAAAKCADYNQILITAGSDDYVTARIPLAYNGGGLFRDYGNFITSFSFSINNKENSCSVAFTYGSGTFDFLKDAPSPVERGFFSGGLNNPSDTAAPVIKSGTVFEMNGNCYTVNSNTAVTASSFSNTCTVFVYAKLVFNQIEFVYSTAPPLYDSYRKGYYNGLERALYKFVFIRDSSNKYFAKTFINYGWSHFRRQTVDSNALASQNLLQVYYLSGAGNPQPHAFTLPAGVYLFTLNGADGGEGVEKTGGARMNGGSGGRISEVVFLLQNTSFTFFTGASGQRSRATQSQSSGQTYIHNSGAGGGSGSFAFSSDGYFLCAGGGGGATGRIVRQGDYNSSYYIDGGAGGSIGGGGSGADTDNFLYIAGSPSAGGIGGGRYEGASALAGYPYSLGFNGNSPYSNSYTRNGSPAAYFSFSAPNNWLNTNNANGKGGDSTGAAQSGGNNRNSTRGGNSGDGSVSVHRIN